MVRLPIHSKELLFQWRSIAAVLIIFLFVSIPVSAHNEKEKIQLKIAVEGNLLRLHYQIKFPKTSSFTELRKMDADGDGAYSQKEKADFLLARSAPFLEKAKVTMDGSAATLRPLFSEAVVSDGKAGLKRLSLVYQFEVGLPQEPAAGSRFNLTDTVFGWDKVELDGVKGELSGEIPGDTLNLTFGQNVAPATEPKNEAVTADDELLNLVSGELTPKLIFWTLGLAFVLGGIHALTPGHGKTMVAAYLVGSRGTIGQAMLLGVVVTVTHTASVFLLGLGCLFAFQYVVPEKIIPWMGFLSGLLITGVGVALIYSRATGNELFHGHSHENGHGHSHESSHAHSHSSEHSHSHESSHGHSHSSEHSHTHDSSGTESAPLARDAEDLGHSHTHSHSSQSEVAELSELASRHPEEKSEKVSLWALVSLGVSGGMVPCPEALMVLLGAISLNRLLLGMAVLTSFSAGLASVLILIGILVVTTSSKVSKKYYPSDDTINRVSIAAYSFICLLGLVIAFRSLTSAGILVLNI